MNVCYIMPLHDLHWLFSVHLRRRINKFGEFTKIGEETVIISFKVRSQRSWGIPRKCWARKVNVLANTRKGQSQNTIHKCYSSGSEEFFFTMVQQPPVGQGLLIVEDSLSHSIRNTTIGRTPLDEWSARSTGL